MGIKKYSKIVVLAKGVTKDDTGPLTFADGVENFSYKIIGDPYEFTFKAIAKLFSNGACSEFILVGGEVEAIQNRVKTKFIGKNGNTVPKAETMKYTLVNKYGIPGENLITLKSTSNTIGNAVEIKRYFTEQSINNTADIGIMTLFYHLPRPLKIFHESGLYLEPICAEGVVYEEEFENIQNFYKGEGFMEIIGEIKGSDSQIKGMGDQEKGSYVPRFN